MYSIITPHKNHAFKKYKKFLSILLFSLASKDLSFSPVPAFKQNINVYEEFDCEGLFQFQEHNIVLIFFRDSKLLHNSFDVYVI